MAIQLPNPGLGDGQTGDNEYVMWTKVKDNFNNTTHAANRLVGTAAGNVMEVGAFGLGALALVTDSINPPKGGFIGWVTANSADTSNVGNFKYGINLAWTGGDHGAQILFGIGDTKEVGYRTWDGIARNWRTFRRFYHEGNTTKDTNGILKAASPVVRLFVDRIEMNDEAELQPITFEKLGVGDYLIKGSLGFAQEGWYIETPKDANGNVLVAVVYEQLDNNDISVKTYDYMLNKKGRIVPDLETPLDIPETRWIDLRLQALPQADAKPFNNYETAILDA